MTYIPNSSKHSKQYLLLNCSFIPNIAQHNLSRTHMFLQNVLPPCLFLDKLQCHLMSSCSQTWIFRMEGYKVYKIAPGICILWRSKVLQFNITLHCFCCLNHVWICTWFYLVHNSPVLSVWFEFHHFTIVFRQSHFQAWRDVWTYEFASFWPPTETMHAMPGLYNYKYLQYLCPALVQTLSNECSFCICLKLLTC